MNVSSNFKTNISNFQKIYLTFLIISFNYLLYSQECLYPDMGTTIIFILRNDTIWIGTDSKVSNNSKELIPPSCKISVHRNLVFTSAGLTHDNFSNIYLDTLFIHCAKITHDVETTLWILNRTLTNT